MASSPCGNSNFDSGLEIKTRSVEQTLIPLVSQEAEGQRPVNGLLFPLRGRGRERHVTGASSHKLSICSSPWFIILSYQLLLVPLGFLHFTGCLLSSLALCNYADIAVFSCHCGCCPSSPLSFCLSVDLLAPPSPPTSLCLPSSVSACLSVSLAACLLAYMSE
ncbi:hypothetical protein PAMP_007951 [Pampus punctatissimus]